MFEGIFVGISVKFFEEQSTSVPEHVQGSTHPITKFPFDKLINKITVTVVNIFLYGILYSLVFLMLSVIKKTINSKRIFKRDKSNDHKIFFIALRQIYFPFFHGIKYHTISEEAFTPLA